MATANPEPGYTYYDKTGSFSQPRGFPLIAKDPSDSYSNLRVDADGALKTTVSGSQIQLSVGDIEIGAVEIKNATTDDRAKVAVVTSLLETDIGIAVMDPVVSASLSTMNTDITGISASIALISKDEDGAHTSGDKGVQFLAVRNDAGTTLVDTDGDYAPLMVNANGLLNINFDNINDIALDIGTGSASTGTQRVAVARNSALSISDPQEDRMAIVVSASVAAVDDYALVVADPIVSASLASWSRGTGSADTWTQRVAVARNSAFSISDPNEDKMATVTTASSAVVSDIGLVVADPIVSASISLIGSTFLKSIDTTGSLSYTELVAINATSSLIYDENVLIYGKVASDYSSSLIYGQTVAVNATSSLIYDKVSSDYSSSLIYGQIVAVNATSSLIYDENVLIYNKVSSDYSSSLIYGQAVAVNATSSLIYGQAVAINATSSLIYDENVLIYNKVSSDVSSSLIYDQAVLINAKVASDYSSSLIYDKLTSIETSSSIWNRYTPAESLISSLQGLTETWTDLGSEVDMRGYTQCNIYLTLDINDSINARIKALGKHESAGADEYDFVIKTVSASDIKIEPEYIEFNTDADQLSILKVETEGVPYLQLQASCATSGSTTGSIDACYINKIWR